MSRDQSTDDTAPSDWLYAGCVFLAFLLAVCLRLGGIAHGDPFVLHTDEPNFVSRALKIVVTGDFNPGWFGHPGTLTIYNLALSYAVQAKLAGEPVDKLLEAYRWDPAPFHVLGRYVILAWSMVCHLGLWLLARQFVPRWPALLAVLLLATAPLDVKLATFIRTDTHQAALLVFLGLILVRAVRTGGLRWFLAAGTLLGLAVAVKWPSVVACLPIALAGLLAPGSGRLWPPSRRKLAAVGIAAAASVLALFVAAPHVFLDFGTVLTDIEREARDYHLGATSPGFGSALLFYLEALFKNASVGAVIFALVGGYASFKQKAWRAYAVMLSLVVVYLLFISCQTLRWERWMVPLLPYTCLLTAIGVSCVHDLARARFGLGMRTRAVDLLSTVALVLASGPHLALVLEQRKLEDVPVEATRWIARHIPSGTKILCEKQTPYLPGGVYQAYAIDPETGKLKRRNPKVKYYRPYEGYVGNAKEAESILGTVEYVVLGNYHKRLRKEPERYRREIQVYDEVLRQTKLVKEFDPVQIRQVRKR